MACVLVPGGEAIILTALRCALNHVYSGDNTSQTVKKIDEKLGYLQKMLGGGSLLLAVEHIYHGEITYVPPFLTAMNNPADTAVMLHEMATNGVAMAAVVTFVWGIMMMAGMFKKKSSVNTLMTLGFISAGLMWAVDVVSSFNNTGLCLLSLGTGLFFAAIGKIKKARVRI